MVSDRLVSGGMSDPLANKNLIYHAGDAIVVIGYAGKAYGLHPSKRDMPTDEWIAETLWGKPIPRGRDGRTPATINFGEAGKVLSIDQAIRLLQTELEKSFQRLPASVRKRSTVHLAIAGWKENRRGIVQFVLAQILKRGGSFIVESPPRYIYRARHKSCVVSFPDGYILAAELSHLAKRLCALTPDASESLFVDEIRRIALLRPDKVGPHCLSILLPPHDIKPIRVRFIPTVEHKALISFPSKGISKTLTVAFSPWILGPRMLSAPALMNGNSTVHMGPITIDLEAPPPQQGISVMSSLKRPPSGS
ncbi:MAG: hypothetical protein ACR2LM_10660 [Pyrinomonadaceae bacterium]